MIMVGTPLSGPVLITKQGKSHVGLFVAGLGPALTDVPIKYETLNHATRFGVPAFVLLRRGKRCPPFLISL